MTSTDAVRSMLEASGLTSYRVSVALGRHSSYVATMLRRGSRPSGDLLARVAAACGYRLQLVPLDGGGPVLVVDGVPDSNE